MFQIFHILREASERSHLESIFIYKTAAGRSKMSISIRFSL